MTYDVEHIFMFICHLSIFVGEMSVKVFGPFFNAVVVFLVLSLKSFLYILDNSPLSDVIAFFFRLNNIPLYVYTKFSLSIHLSMNI